MVVFVYICMLYFCSLNILLSIFSDIFINRVLVINCIILTVAKHYLSSRLLIFMMEIIYTHRLLVNQCAVRFYLASYTVVLCQGALHRLPPPTVPCLFGRPAPVPEYRQDRKIFSILWNLCHVFFSFLFLSSFFSSSVGILSYNYGPGLKQYFFRIV